ncbi:MAG: class I SAM-dependent methyltransferase [Planctomycetota bacterium]|nr:class I SAM-dependent methyltransferase [Planctomycetota bacterium]
MSTTTIPSIRLSQTGAMVMDWARPLYRTGLPHRLIAHLDVGAGQDLRRRCEAVCPWYGEVILNRKAFVRGFAEWQLSQANGPRQVILPGAGATALPLELAPGHPDRVERTLEIDTALMAEKQHVYGHIAPTLAGRLVCVEADVTAPDLGDRLVAGGFYSEDVPAIIILEGLSYYLPREALVRLLGQFASGCLRNAVLIEHLLPAEHIAEDRRSIPDRVFGIIRARAGLDAPARYGPEDVADVLRDVGGRVTAYHTMTEMERDRTGTNTYFPGPADGWIGCTIGRL